MTGPHVIYGWFFAYPGTKVPRDGCSRLCTASLICKINSGFPWLLTLGFTEWKTGMDLKKGELDRLLSSRGISGSKMFVIPFIPYNNYPNPFKGNLCFSTRTHTYNRFLGRLLGNWAHHRRFIGNCWFFAVQLCNYGSRIDLQVLRLKIESDGSDLMEEWMWREVVRTSECRVIVLLVRLWI